MEEQTESVLRLELVTEVRSFVGHLGNQPSQSKPFRERMLPLKEVVGADYMLLPGTASIMALAVD